MFLKKIKEIFHIQKEENESEDIERTMRDLLRENLNSLSVDVFHLDDPIVLLNPSQRREYLLYFNKLVTEKKVIHRLEYLINKQANMTLLNSRSGQLDTAGVMKMDGLGTFKDDVERLSKMFLTEEEELNRRPLSPADSLRL